MKVRTYSELRRLHTFDERFDYLVLGGEVSDPTFGSMRHMNQDFYRSSEWLHIRRQAVLRDNGCDLGVPGMEINTELLVHHINPMSPDDLVHGADWILDLEYLITTSKNTHNAIHYGGRESLRTRFVERKPGDTRLW